MATQLQIRRGTTAQTNNFSGAEGELSVNTSTDTVHVHDGATAGGHALAKADGSNISTYAGSFTTLAASGAATLSSTLAVTSKITANGGIALGDNDKATFGGSDDLQIYHNGSDSIVADVGTGNLKLLGNDLRINNADSSKSYFSATNGGSAIIYHNAAAKLATSATGVIVTGAVETSAGGTFTTASGNDLNIVYPTGRSLFIKEGSDTHVTVDNAGNVGIGVTSIQASAAGKTLETSGCLISGGTLSAHQTNRAVIEYNVGSNSMNLRAYGASAGTGVMIFSTGGGGGSSDSEHVRIDGSGTTTFTKSGGGNIRIAETASRYVEIMGYAEGAANGSTMAFSTIQSGTSTSTERFRIDPAGKLLVNGTSGLSESRMQVDVAVSDPNGGTPTANSALMVNGGTTTVGKGPVLAMRNVNGAKETIVRMAAETVSGNNGDFTMSLYRGGGTVPEALRVTAAGNVCIGTDSPTLAGTGFTGLSIKGTGASITLTNGSNQTSFIYTSSNQPQLNFETAGAYVIRAGSAERARIHASGCLAVKGTADDARFGIYAQGNDSIRWANAGTAGKSGGDYPYIGYNVQSTTTAGSYARHINDKVYMINFGSNSRLGVYTSSSTSGTLSLTAGPYVSQNGTSWTNSSDSRLKNISGEITGGIEKIKAMRPVNYTLKTDEKNTPQVGFIAQEMLSVVPEVVDVPETETDEITGDTLMWGINYDRLVPVLTAALKEAITKIETLEAKVTALENE